MRRLLRILAALTFLTGGLTPALIALTPGVASAGPCGMWPHDLGATLDREHSDNLEYWNFGCAAQRNLASMVDDPSDLVQPRGEAPAYNARRTTVLDKYGKGQSTPTIYPNPNAGKISDIGQ